MSQWKEWLFGRSSAARTMRSSGRPPFAQHVVQLRLGILQTVQEHMPLPRAAPALGAHPARVPRLPQWLVTSVQCHDDPTIIPESGVV